MSGVPFRTDRVRLIVFLKRRSDLTREEFSHYWNGPHAELFLSLDIVKKNVIKYEQAHVNDKFVKAPLALGLTESDWDGLVVLDGESYEKLFEVFSSEEYAKIVAPDEENFLDRAKVQILPLDLVTVFE
ncbi:hypothetical protein DXG03_009128 [Asterophora parasitica]|uniref:EthD domain-containing protein n=1 Tax=Asterophora parasitica TaxID=117018 RepID=A0A9P7G584_9AGAR|nr:hypothetical protein DXG03_009128 [Asterophora parasitica]